MNQAYTLGNDSELRLLLGYSGPPRAGRITAVNPASYTVEIADSDAAAVEAWPLNGAVYAEGNVVYVLQAENAPDSGVIVGRKGALTRLGIGTASPQAALDVRGAMYSTSSIGWLYGKNIPDNAATAIARVNFPSGALLGAFLVTVSVSAVGVRAMRTYLVTMRYNGVDVTALNSPSFIGVSSLELTASANATARTMTLSAKQVSGATQSGQIAIQPLAIRSNETVTFTGL